MELNRRRFIQVGAATGGGLLLGFPLIAADDERTWQPSVWLEISSDDVVTFYLDKAEMGQGVSTALPTILCEELAYDPKKMRIEQAPADRAYINPEIGIQITGGSTSVSTAYQPLRQAGATARQMLVQAAAAKWGLAEATLIAEDGQVFSADRKRTASYGALASAAAKLPAPEPKLKDPKDFALLGKTQPRLDSRAKVLGQTTFGIDVTQEGLRTAVVARCPVFGGKLRSVDSKASLALPGVEKVVTISAGAAVVGDSYWAVKKGRDALQLTWDEGPLKQLSSASIAASFDKSLSKSGSVERDDGDFSAAIATCEKKLQAAYKIPYLAHTTMEPMNCTASVTKVACHIWAPTQAAGLAQQVAHDITGLPYDSIFVHPTMLGGGFGRRCFQDFVAEAVELAMKLDGPVKVLWSREDDMQHDFYRPGNHHIVEAGLDEKGLPKAWSHKLAGPSILAQHIPNWAPATLPTWVPGFAKRAASWAADVGLSFSGTDATSVEGIADMPYAIPNARVEYVVDDPGIPVGFWRSVGHSYSAFVMESIIDEMAHLAEQDPLAYRRSLLQGQEPYLRVLNLAAEKAGWGRPRHKGCKQGIAIHKSFGSYVAEVAEVAVSKSGEVQVKRVVAAVDCGRVINPDIVRAQVEGSIVYGLSAALTGKITFKDGRVQEENFHQATPLRFDAMPEVETHLVESTEDPRGIGEPALPPIAPAVTNAIFAATGKRVRELPIQV